MDRYRVAAPTRPVFLSGASSHGGGRDHRLPLPPPPPTAAVATGRRSGCAELDIFSAERYFNVADVVRCSSGGAGAVVVPAAAGEPPDQLACTVAAVDAVSQSGRTFASSEASWNSRSGLLSSNQSARLQNKGYGGDGGKGVVVAAASDPYHRGCRNKTSSGQRWGLFSRDCPCAGRKAVTVDVASEPASPMTQQRVPAPASSYDASSAMDQETTVFKARKLPYPTQIREPAKMKIAPGTGALPIRATNNSSNIFPAAASNGGSGSFAAFPPDIGHRVVTSGGFTFPVLGGTAARGAVSTVEEPPRESLEVFRPIDEDSVVLVDPPPAVFPHAPAVAPAMEEEEAMSDASSDLFDLESFAASSSYPTTYRGRSSRRNARDEDLAYATAAAAAEPALSECMYAPSEVSVVWSVATAEGGAYDATSVANFSSAASACCVDEFRFVPPEAAAGAGHDGFTATMSRSAGRKKGGGGGGFLNSCRCEKAVSVGPTPVRVVRPPAHPAAKTAGHGAARYHHQQQGRVHMPVRT